MVSFQAAAKLDTKNLQTLQPSRTGAKPADTAALQDWS
uniref:Uncharacterized protein n=1 Tax=Anguilla anguilla TaxID=7936 RepID=A0A0E9PX28_ANGAN